MKPVISLRSISKSYSASSGLDALLTDLFPRFYSGDKNSNKVLKDISFDIWPGEVVGIVGKNGAGKSTLLKIISGVIQPDSGDIEVNGRISAMLELGASFNPEFTGLENIRLYGLTLGLSEVEIESYIPEILEFADIGEKIHSKVRTYSSGMFARVAFSAAIHMKPKLIIVDEILSVGDVFFQQKCIEKMKSTVASGATVLFVSHDMHAMKFFCDRIIYLESGVVEKDGYDVVNILDIYTKGIAVDKEEYYSSGSRDTVAINSTKFFNGFGVEKNSFRVGEKLVIKISYSVYSLEAGSFLGFGVRNQDGVYVFGYNTKLDKCELSLQPGQYTAELSLDSSMLYKGTFDCWSVIYNSTGTVLQAEFTQKRAFDIRASDEKCEGIVNLSREWKIEVNQNAQ